MIEQELFSHLKTNVPSVSERIYPLIMPQGCIKPALVYTVVSDGDQQTISGCVTAQQVRFQVDIYGTSYTEVKGILTEVKSALYSFNTYPLGLNSRDGFESEQELFRQIIDFTLRSN